MPAENFLKPTDFGREVAAVTDERMYVLPHPALRRAVSHYTVFSPRAGAPAGRGVLHIVPDASGCIVCERSEPFAPLYWGPTSRVVTVDNDPERRALLVFAEFLPGGANRILHLPLHGLENAVLPLDAVDPALAARMADSFLRRFYGRKESDCSAFFDDLDRLFLDRLAEHDESLLADHVLSAVARAGGLLRAGRLARETGYSERHLNRVLAERLGFGVKLLSRIVRVNEACRALAAPGPSLTAVAHRLGYHDQSHFIRDFASICGMSPGKYREDMSDFYNEELKLAGTMPSR